MFRHILGAKMSESKYPSKADVLVEKMNRITKKFSEKIEDADDLLVSTSDIESEAEAQIEEIKNSYPSEFGTEFKTEFENNPEESEDKLTFNLQIIPEILNLENMVKDVKYIRETLHDTIETGKAMLKTVAGELSFEMNPEMLAAFAQLSGVLTENMKLFLQCYKDMSNILININKLVQSQKTAEPEKQIAESADIVTTAELIKSLSEIH